MKFEIFNRWSGKVQFVAEIEAKEDDDYYLKVGLAVQWGFKNGARLDGARLDGARLVGARLDGASLDGASLDGARLVGARLDGARLDGARLDGARLVGASLDGASLDGASLDGASLVGASLDGARLVGASLDGARLDGARLDGARLVGARLDGARLVGANLKTIRGDFWQILLQNQKEVNGLLEYLRIGKIDGTVYSGECACLMGTIANIRHCDVDDLEKDSSRPAECWFMGIAEGDTPETNPVSKITEQWILEFLELINQPKKDDQ